MSGPVWEPLERFCAIVSGRIGAVPGPFGVLELEPAAFMFMGEATEQGCEVQGGGGPVFLYKHCDTRRYLNLDAAGHCYVYVPPLDPLGDRAGSYRLCADPRGAVLRVLA